MEQFHKYSFIGSLANQRAAWFIVDSGNKLKAVYKVLKDTLNASDDFKNKQKSVWSNGFWYVKACIFWEQKC